MDYEFDDHDLDEPEPRSHEPRSDLKDEASYICNSCGEEIVVPLDHSEGKRQEYVEDCPVCCNPNVIFVEFDSEGRSNIWSRSEQDPR
jgi:hypothetical protein